MNDYEEIYRRVKTHLQTEDNETIKAFISMAVDDLIAYTSQEPPEGETND